MNEKLVIEELALRINAYHLAALVGLRNARAEIKAIVSFDNPKAIDIEFSQSLERWLDLNKLPRIKFRNGPPPQESICDGFLRRWNWGHRECLALLRLEGLPTP